MTDAKDRDKTAEGDSLAPTFHQVHRLVPIEQKLLEIEPNMRVADAWIFSITAARSLARSSFWPRSNCH